MIVNLIIRIFEKHRKMVSFHNSGFLAVSQKYIHFRNVLKSIMFVNTILTVYKLQQEHTYTVRFHFISHHCILRENLLETGEVTIVIKKFYSFQTARVTTRTIPGLCRIHPRTVRNRLREHHIRPRWPCVRTLLLPRHRAECLRWSRAHLTWRLKEWDALLFSDESRFSLDHQMVGLWCTAGWASATNMHAFDRDVRLAVGVWWCGVAFQPIAGHPWSLLMAVWMHTTTWRRLLDHTCCPPSVVREGTWPFSRTMLDHTLRVSSWIFSEMRMCWWWLGPRCPPIRRQSSRCGTKWTDGWDNDQTSPSWCKDLAKPCKKFGKKSHKHSASVSGMCQCARWSDTILTAWTVV